VAVRLLCPLTPESRFSLLPGSVGSGELVSEWKTGYLEDIQILREGSEHYENAVAAGREPVQDGNGGYYVITGKDQRSEPATVENTVLPVAGVIWAVGVLALLGYSVVSFLSLRRKVETAVRFRGNIFQSEHIGSPFVLGILKPKIYLPFRLDDRTREHVIAHEQAHIRRKDHWWKPLGFLLLTVYWFNPLIWVAYVLLCRDIELACDEKVIGKLDSEGRADYTQSLVTYSVNRRAVVACPLAFGEVGVKERVASVMYYKKPGFWILAATVLVFLAATVGFLTTPSSDHYFFRVRHKISGQIIELHVGEENRLLSFAIRTDRGKILGISFSDETNCFSFVSGMTEEAFLKSPRTDVTVNVVGFRSFQGEIRYEGKPVPTYDAESVTLLGYREQENTVLADGTELEVWQYLYTRKYQLPDGTELLYERDVVGPEHVYVAGVESLDEISQTVSERIMAFYQDRGLLYNIREELENAYVRCSVQNEDEWRALSVSQEIAPSASNETVICFLTMVMRPGDLPQNAFQLRLGEVFDKKTGERIDNWDMFSCDPEEALETIMDLAGEKDPALREEMKKAAQPENIVFFQDNLEISFPMGTLSGYPDEMVILMVDYDERMTQILQPWAVPRIVPQ